LRAQWVQWIVVFLGRSWNQPLPGSGYRLGDEITNYGFIVGCLGLWAGTAQLKPHNSFGLQHHAFSGRHNFDSFPIWERQTFARSSAFTSGRVGLACMLHSSLNCACMAIMPHLALVVHRPKIDRSSPHFLRVQCCCEVGCYGSWEHQLKFVSREGGGFAPRGAS